jgi:hypothetical protein
LIAKGPSSGFVTCFYAFRINEALDEVLFIFLALSLKDQVTVALMITVTTVQLVTASSIDWWSVHNKSSRLSTSYKTFMIIAADIIAKMCSFAATDGVTNELTNEVADVKTADGIITNVSAATVTVNVSANWMVTDVSATATVNAAAIAAAANDVAIIIVATIIVVIIVAIAVAKEIASIIIAAIVAVDDSVGFGIAGSGKRQVFN